MDKVYFIVYGTRSKIEHIDGKGAYLKLEDAERELNNMGYEGKKFAKYKHSASGEMAYIMCLEVLS